MEWVAVLSSVATAVSAVVIAWQALLTRSALTLTRETLSETRVTRLDSRAPRVLLGVPKYPNTEGAEIRQFTFGGGEFQDIVDGTLFTLPRHEEWEIRWRFTLSVMNDGPGSVVPEFESGMRVSVLEAGALVPAGEVREFTVSVNRSVEEWIKAAETGWDKDAPATEELSLSIHGPNDSDVSDRWIIRLRGSLLEHPAGDRTGWAYTNATFNSLHTETQREPRIYWRSRASDETIRPAGAPI